MPNPQAASWDRHRMFRVHYPEPEMAARMRDALAAWEALWLDLGGSHYVERGTLALSRTAGDWSERTGTALAAVGAPLERFTERLIERQRQMYAADRPFIEKWRTAMAYLESHRARGEVVTGLLYARADSTDMHDALETIDAPLNTLGDAELVPGSAALAALNASLR